jgi:hypothetical protein
VTANATSTITGLSAATDTVTETATALANGDKIIFTDVGRLDDAGPGPDYFVVEGDQHVQGRPTSGGSAVTIGTATVSYRKPWTTALATVPRHALLQGVYDNGGITEQATATLIVNSTQKLALSNAYANSYGKFVETSGPSAASPWTRS